MASSAIRFLSQCIIFLFIFLAEKVSETFSKKVPKKPLIFSQKKLITLYNLYFKFIF